MAEKKAKLIIELSDLLSKPIAGIIGKIGELKAGYVALAGALSGVVVFLKDALQEYGKSQEAAAKLEGALKRMGQESTGAKERLLEQAAALQSVTTYADEAITEMQALLTTFGYNEAAVRMLTPRILDLAAATGIDLRTATVSLAKSIESGSVTALRRYGIALDEAAFLNKDFQAITQQLDAKFKDQAIMMGQTLPGQAARLSNAYSDLKEKIGELISGPAGNFYEILIKISQGAAIAIDKIVEFTGWLQKFNNAVINTALSVASFVPGMSGLAKTMQMTLAATKGMTTETTKGTKAINDQKPAVKSLAEEHKKLDNVFLVGAKTREEAYTEELNKRMAKTQEWFDQNISVNDAIRLHFMQNAVTMSDIWVGTIDTMVNSFSSGMAHLIVNGGNFEDAMRQIGKNVLEYFVQQIIAQMVARWIAGVAAMNAASATLGVPGLGAAVGAGAAGAGGLGAIGGILGSAGILGLDFAYGQKNGLTKNEGILSTAFAGFTGGSFGVSTVKNIAKKAKKLFSGGVINEPTLMVGTRSGAVGLAGEKGIPEALISFPEMGLTPSQGRERLLGTGRGRGGGGHTVVIQAGTVVAGDYSVRQFARKIDEHLFRLSNNRQGVQG